MFSSLRKFAFSNNKFLRQMNEIKTFATLMTQNQPLFVITMNSISDNKGARKLKTRLGRGPGSGLGKTCGRGTKGMKSRTGGKVNSTLEGGQTNFMRRTPKRGFTLTGMHRKPEYLNLSKLVYYVNKGMLDPSKTITIRDLFEVGAISKVKNGLKLLGRGGVAVGKVQPMHVEVSWASKEAIDKIKENGGTVTCVYRTPLTLKYHIKPYKFHRALIDPIPTFKKTKKLVALEERGAK